MNKELKDYLEIIIRENENFDVEEREMLVNFLQENGQTITDRLTPREIQVLSLRAGGLTLKDTGKELGVTTERIRQIERKATLRFINGCRLLLKRKQGEKVELYSLAEEEQELIQQLKERIPKLKALIEYIDGLSVDKKETPSNIEVVLGKNIIDLDFSVRSYNCLVRYMANNYGIHKVTLRDLSRLTTDELLKIRNLGKRSFNEIIDKLAYFGIYLN